MTALYNIVGYQKSSLNLRFLWKDEDGNPKDITGYEAAMQVRPYKTPPKAEFLGDVAIEATTENTKLIIDGLEGAINLALRRSDMDVDAGKYRYDLLIWQGPGDEENAVRLVAGDFSVRPAVTEI